jgi:6-phosphogluconolactonase
VLTKNMGTYELIHCDAPQGVAQIAADALLDQIAAARDKPFCLGLSGGRIAEPFFKAVVQEAGARRLSLDNVEFFWVDERCVPPESSESNYHLAWEHLLGPMQTPPARVHRVRGEIGGKRAAEAAEAEIRGLAPAGDDGQPVLDLVLLGMGEDGHVASLFPDEPEEVRNRKEVYRVVDDAPKPPPERVTMNYRALKAARQAWVLVSGAGKEAALRDSLAVGGPTPLGRVISLRDHTRIMTDLGL